MELVDNPASPGHPRLTIAAAALAVLAVLVIPPVVIGLVDLAAPVAPVERFPTFSLTDRARQVAELPGANVLADSVVLTLTPEMNAPVMQPSQIVLPDESTGQLVPLGVSGLLPMTPDLAPAGTGGLMSGLVPGDKVFANLGPLVASCLVGPGDTAGSCTPTLLTQHSTGYYRYPGAWGTATFLDDGSPMQADLLDVLGSRLVAGGLPGTDADKIVVVLADGSEVTAFTTGSASPGDTIWWASVQRLPLLARAYDAAGHEIADVDLSP